MAFSKPGGFEQWGSATTGYHDPYGRGGTMPIHARAPEADAGCKVCVSNLPMMNEDGIRRIFGKYGHVLHISQGHNGTWAFITYASYGEARLAVESLHKVPPFDLEVTLCLDEERPGTRQLDMSMRSMQKPEDGYPYNNGLMLNHFRSVQQPAVAPDRSYANQRVQPYREFHYPVIPEPCLHNPYETGEPLTAATNMWNRDHMRTTEDGMRQVNMGLNQNLCNIPQEHPKIFQQILKLHEMRQTASFGQRGNMLQGEDNKCQCCGKFTTTHCQRCRAFYCGRKCQETDWPNHSIKCQPIPDLTESINPSMRSRSSSEENMAPFGGKKYPQPLRRPRRIQENPFIPNSASTPLLTVPADIYPSPQTSPKSNDLAARQIREIKENLLSKQASQNGKVDNVMFNYSPPKKLTERLNTFKRTNEHNKGVSSSKNKSLKSPTEQKKFGSQNRDASQRLPNRNQKCNSREAQKPTDGKTEDSSNQSTPTRVENVEKQCIGAFPNRTGNTAFFAADQFTKVKIVFKEAKGIYWVQKEEDQDAFVAMMRRLDSKAEGFQKVVPTIGNVYAVRFEGLWHRAILTSAEPMKVLYVDFGNEATLNDDDFRKLENDDNMPFFAQKICLGDGTPDKYRELVPDESLSVKPIDGATENGILVQIEGLEALKENPAIASTSGSTETSQVQEAAAPEGPFDAFPATKAPRENLVNRKFGENSQIKDNLEKCSVQNREVSFKKNTHAKSQNARDTLQKQELKSKPGPSRLAEPDCNFVKRTVLDPPVRVERPCLPENVFTEVKVVVPLKNGEYWVHRVQDQEVFQTMMVGLNQDADELQKVKPIVGNIYAHRFYLIWHRVVFTSSDPQRVHYADYGNDEPPSDDDFRKLKKPYDASFFALKIRLAEGSSEKYMSLAEEVQLFVKPLNRDADGVVVVQVEGDNLPVPAETPSTSQSDQATPVETQNTINSPLETSKATSEKSACSDRVYMKNVLDSVVVGTRSVFEVASSLGDNKVSGMVYIEEYCEDLKKILEVLPEACEKMPEDSDFRPKIGDFICGKRGEDWLRGYVVELGPPLQLSIVDEGQVQPVDTIRPCPEGYDNMPAFGGTYEMLRGDLQLEPGNNYLFEVTGSRKVDSQQVFEVIVTMSDKKNIGLLKSYLPPLQQKGISRAQLNSGSEVNITAAVSPAILFVRSLALDDLKQFKRIMDGVAKCAKTALPLTTPPVVGKMVIAKFSDGNYYRAIVRRIDDEKIGVSYVDFGNDEDTTLKNLKQITEEVENYTTCTSKVLLKDVPRNATSTKATMEFLNKLINTETPLVCTFDGAPATDGVYLKSATGASVNTKIISLLNPSAITKAKQEVFMGTDVEVASLGKVGDIVSAVVLYMTDPGIAYMMCPEDIELIQNIEILAAKIQVYCGNTKDHFVPDENELCLALFQGSFYRAMCLKTTLSSNNSTVLFIDYGNIEDVPHKDIRRMTKDFVGTKALASLCQVTGLGSMDERGSARVKELVTDNKVVKLKIVEVGSNASYVVELPEVHATLVKEGLIAV